MSFSDLMSSGRGPGVIGMVMALIVLLGFGALFMFAFDEGMQGADRSIESIIREQSRDIGHLQHGIQDGKTRLELTPGRLGAMRELSLLKRITQTQHDRIAELTAEVASAEAGMVDDLAKVEAYKDRYRAQVRSAAKGSEIKELQTTRGITYKNVNIREVTAIGIQIRHEDGQKRIPFEDLPEEMQDHFQFDPSQKAQALVEENQTREEHEAEAAVANVAANEQMAQQRAKDAALAREGLIRQIEYKEAQIESLEQEVNDLSRKADAANSAASAARSSGRMHINKAGTYTSSIRSKRNRIAALNHEIMQMKSRL